MTMTSDVNSEVRRITRDEPARVKRKSDLLELAINAEARAKNHFFGLQKQDGHWCAELESNASITAEYIFMCQILNLDISKRRGKLLRYFLSHQKEDGSWGIAYNYAGDVSSTAEVYLALRILGVAVDESAMQKAQKYILDQGGLEKMRIFTRINFAMFGLFPWDAVPAIPPEFILLPSQSPVNIYSLSSWARGTMVPLFIIFHHKPIFELPNGCHENNKWLDHLWKDPSDKHLPYSESFSEVLQKNALSWQSIFTGVDVLLRSYEGLRKMKYPSKLRSYAVKKCEQWVLSHQEKSGDWAGIFPPMLNGCLALYLQGYSLSSDALRLGLEAIERFTLDDAEGFRVQACQSPIWDTILGMIGVLDTGHDPKDPKLVQGFEWISKKQLLVNYGDWKVYNPDGPSGGWSFEYDNSWYPDVDDTAAVVIGFLKQDRAWADKIEVKRAVEWIVSMQNRDGGWAAFDINNDKTFLNEIPFSDMDSLCDPSSPDVTGRVLEALGILGDSHYNEVCDQGIEYLRNSQTPQGSWYGRWGVNYVYGTSNVLCALARQEILGDDPMVSRAIAWLKSVQNSDGGWGECLESYTDPSLMGKGVSTASQTAWGLMALLAYLPAKDPAIEKGIRWLAKKQKANGEWKEEEFTGTGFPNHFYLRYHLYRQYFPLMALGRYCRARLS